MLGYASEEFRRMGFHRGDRLEEVRDLLGVGYPVALEEERLRGILAHSGGGVRDYLGGTVIARLQHPLAAEDLETLIVPVGRAPGDVDLAQTPAPAADDHHRRVGVASV